MGLARTTVWVATLVFVGALIVLTAADPGRVVGDPVSPRPASPSYSPGASVLIRAVPHVQQSPDFCGEACAEMVLRKLGKNLSQKDVFNAAGLDPALGRGCYTKELDRALKALGFDVGRVWYEIPLRRGGGNRAANAKKELARQWQALHQDLAAGIPSIVCTRYDESPQTTEHFRLVLGYDPRKDTVIYHEPAVKNGAYRTMTRERFLGLWPLKYSRDNWTLIRFRMQPKRVISRAPRYSGRFSPADFALHVQELKKRLPNKDFTIHLEPPFVVCGDEAPGVVRSRSKRTIRWAADLLKKDYFKEDPKHIIDIWLFKDKKSYRKHTRELFGDNPSTPFGYYSSQHRALVMNISTGGGTLVHEIVHPFIEFNFPECPSWFNEGLASLYEQCGARGGKITGFTNWRLADLQRAIRAGNVPQFRTLTSTTTREFYEEDPGTNYSQARYLCYYLQEKGLLRKFYHRFHRDRKKDPTGYQSLCAVLGEKDLEKFKKRWEAFVLKLGFRG